MRNLDNFKEKAKHCRGIITSLAASLKTRLGHVTTESLFGISTFLNPNKLLNRGRTPSSQGNGSS